MKILLAEDNADARALMLDILDSARAGYEVTAVENGAAAWDALNKIPDMGLAILDVMMPEISGIELLGLMRSDTRFAKLPVIVCTANTDRATVAQVAAHGVNCFLVKPYTRSSVLEKLRQIFRPRVQVASGLKDVAEVRTKLDIDREAHRELLSHHLRLLGIWLADVRTAQRWAEVRALAIRTRELREASLTLGAADLAARCEETGVLFDSRRTAPGPAELRTLLEKIVVSTKAAEHEGARLRTELESMN
jgi:CheY-like chemotaxis protein